jgi:hypothetical protein
MSSAQISLDSFAVNHLFNRWVGPEGEVILWRDCILAADMHPSSQGYIWVYPDGSCHHSYRNPEQLWGKSK